MIALAFRPPIDVAQLLAWFGARAIPGVERVTEGVYRRTLRVEGRPTVVEVAEIDGELRLSGADGLAGLARRVFDLDVDPAVIAAHLRRDPLLAPMVAARPGLRVPGAWDPFETAVRGILGQQVAVGAATTLSGRLVARFGEAVDLGPGLTHLFPTPVALAEADVAAIGIPRSRGRTVQVFATAIARGEVALDARDGLDAFCRRLCELPGIGPWTASYVAMRALGEPDAFPAGDLALKQVTGLDARALEARAEAWRPWRAYAAMHLWASLWKTAG